MVWGGRRKEGSGWGTHVYLWQIHFDIWQNQYNIVKLKNKIKLKKKEKKKHLLPWSMPAFCFWSFGSSLLSLLWIFFQVDYLFPFYSFDFAGFCLAVFVCNIFLSSHFCWWMQLCSCLAGSLAWGLQQWSLLAVGWSRVLALRWGQLRELTSINISWSLNFSGSPAAWTPHSHCSSSVQPLAWHWIPKHDAAKKTK